MITSHVATTGRPDTHQKIHELTHPHTHLERITTHTPAGTAITRPHHVQAPALLTQLAQAEPLTGDSDQMGAGYRSNPAANIDALDLLAHIDHTASVWVKRLGHNDPGTTAACVQLAGSLTPQTTTCTTPPPDRRDDCCLHHDIDRWWTRARILTGWDTPAWRPDNTCPICGTRGTLRIRLTDQTATCIHTDPDTAQRCGATWDPATIGLLAEHIRGENHDDPDQAGLYVASFGQAG